MIEDMLALAIITSSIWFGVGIWVGWRRAKSAYKLELASFPSLAQSDPIQVKRGALLRALAVFYGWTVAGLLGALVWFIMCIWLMVGHAVVEERARSSGKKRDTGGAAFWLIIGIGGLLMINVDTLRATERNFDSFVVSLSAFITILALFLVYASLR